MVLYRMRGCFLNSKKKSVYDLFGGSLLKILRKPTKTLKTGRSRHRLDTNSEPPPQNKIRPTTVTSVIRNTRLVLS
jgi:hypothetical protein